MNIMERKKQVEKMWQLECKCHDIYNGSVGIEDSKYHDEMLYQLNRFYGHCATAECMKNQEVENFERYLKDAEDTYKWFQHVQKIWELETSMPESIFG